MKPAAPVTWTTTAHDTTTSTLMPTAISITDGGNCECTPPAGDVAA